MPETKAEWTGRMDNMEKRQDDRHHENVEALRTINEMLIPLVSGMRLLCGDSQYRGRMGVAEDDIKELDKAVGAIKSTITKWSGIMIGAFGLIEIASKLIDKFK
jgi:hypothetical protein